MANTAPNRSIHTPKCRKFTHSCLHFFCPPYAYFLRITLSISLHFVPHIRGHMARTPLPSPLLRSNREKSQCSELSFLPWRPLVSNWCAFMQPSSVIRSTQAARRFLRPICILMILFQAYISRLERTHTWYLMIIYLWCIFTCGIISISFDISHDIGIEISWKCYRCWYRYIIPKISHDILEL